MTQGKTGRPRLGKLPGNPESPVPNKEMEMARTPKRSRTNTGSKAAQAAQQQAAQRRAKNGGAFDASKMQVLYESDPIELPNDKDGVLSVRVYSYDGNDPRIGVYRVVWSVKQNREFQMRDLRPLDLEQSEQLHKELGTAIKFLKKLQASK